MKGNIFFNSEKNDEAIKVYSKIIEINPELSEVYCQRGITFIKLKNYKESLEDLHKSIKLNPKNRKANAAIGEIYLIQGKNDEGFRLKQEYEGNINFSKISGVEITGGYINEEIIGN